MPLLFPIKTKMAITYHIQTWGGVRPQPFISRLDVKSITRGRSRVLGGIHGGKTTVKRRINSKDTTTNVNIGQYKYADLIFHSRH